MSMTMSASPSPFLFFTFFQLATSGINADSTCMLTAKRCERFPSFAGTQFSDRYGEQMLGAGDTPAACLRRAEDFHHWCGNGRDSEKATVAATHVPSMQTQIYHPTACPDLGWSLYHKHCYIHVWRQKTWWEAEAWCQERGGNLCSIHGKQENEFVFTLTKGLTSWIGYEDQDQDQEHKWSDNTPANYENMAKNCTGRETEPDCAPQETAQQWYDWEGHDKATWVCKKEAKWNLALLRNETTSYNLTSLSFINWEDLKKPLADEMIRLDMSRSVEDEIEEEELKQKEEGMLPTKEEVASLSASSKKPCLTCKV
ncbi:unnamed protein product [Amoebophrya sp. A120]|nr:unnamed protein product [Amoebophrya sp. A120]|eukprot:GSA120T00023290001.1